MPTSAPSHWGAPLHQHCQTPRRLPMGMVEVVEEEEEWVGVKDRAAGWVPVPVPVRV